MSPAPPITAFVTPSLLLTKHLSPAYKSLGGDSVFFFFSFHLVLGWNDGFEHGCRTVYHQALCRALGGHMKLSLIAFDVVTGSWSLTATDSRPYLLLEELVLASPERTIWMGILSLLSRGRLRLSP